MKILLNIREQFRLSEFETSGFELKIKEDTDTPPLIIVIDNSNNILVEGVVDRIDTWKDETGNQYIRVVDYKSGQKIFNLADVYNGLNLQMLLYLFSLCRQYQGRSNNIPAGILYMPTKDSVINITRKNTIRVIESERKKLFKMNGLILSDNSCLQAMEKGIQGMHIPAKVKKDGEIDAKSSVISKTQFDIIEKYIEEKIRAMGENLIKGNFPARPLKKDNRLPCEYCDYKMVCKFEEDSECNEFIKISPKDVINQIDLDKESQ